MLHARRWREEREFHDRQALARARTLQPADLRFADETYLAHESWIAPAFAALGAVRGRCVLDLGCGHGMAAVVLARGGAQVTACDLSTGYLNEARARAAANGVTVDTVAAAGEFLPFRAGAFDAIWGNAVLHHLDLRLAAREIWRVLRPNGRAVFCEPWGGNPCVSWARTHLPYPGKQRTPDERPLAPADVTLLRTVFQQVAMEGHQLLAMATRAGASRRLTTGLHSYDKWLLSTFPNLRRYCRYVVLVLQK